MGAEFEYFEGVPTHVYSEIISMDSIVNQINTWGMTAMARQDITAYFLPQRYVKTA